MGFGRDMDTALILHTKLTTLCSKPLLRQPEQVKTRNKVRCVGLIEGYMMVKRSEFTTWVLGELEA